MQRSAKKPPRRIANANMIPEVDVWRLYLSKSDLQSALLSWPCRRFVTLTKSPGTTALTVEGRDSNEGRVDLSVRGTITETGEACEVFYSVWRSESSYAARKALLSTILAAYPRVPRDPTGAVRRGVTHALGMSLSK